MKIIFFILLFVAMSGFTRYEVPARDDVVRLSGIIMRQQVGVRELTGRNDGKMIEEYLRSVGLPNGNPYCAAGQYYCFAEAVARLGLGNNFIPLKKTGLANAMFNDAANRGTKTSYNAQPDDLIFWRKGKTAFGHVERIVAINRAGWVVTIGFNTGSGNQRDGDGVYFRRRHVTNPLGLMIVRGLIGFKRLY